MHSLSPDEIKYKNEIQRGPLIFYDVFSVAGRARFDFAHFLRVSRGKLRTEARLARRSQVWQGCRDISDAARTQQGKVSLKAEELTCSEDNHYLAFVLTLRHQDCHLHITCMCCWLAAANLCSREFNASRVSCAWHIAFE